MFIEVPEYIYRFESFTNLVTERFDVSVVLDGQKACTDGKTISLPNIYGMTENEVEFLYGILLHEVGHIRHTSFEKDLIKGFKSQAHFLLYNAMEDARIENAIMKEYGGAYDIFAELYAKSNDPSFMQKVFGGDGSSPKDPFFVFGLMLHDVLVDVPSPLPKVRKNVRDKAQEMYDKVKHLVEGAVLKNSYDVQDLATEIYDIIFKSEADKSEKISVKEDEKKKEEEEKKLNDLLSRLEEVERKAQELRDKVKPERDQLTPLNKQKRDLKKNYNKEHKQYSKLDRKLSKQTDPLYEEIQDRLAEAWRNLSAASGAKSDIQNEIDKLERKLERNQEGLEKAQEMKKSRDKDEQKKGNTKEKYHTNRKNKLEAEKKTLEEKLKQLEEAVKQAKQNLENEKNKPGGQSGKTPNQLQEMIDQLEKNSGMDKVKDQMEAIEQQIRDLENQMKPLRDKISDAHEKAQQMRQDALKKNMKDIMKAAQSACDAGLPSPIPKFEENDDWGEADDVQKQFDNQASKELEQPVINGMSPFGHNVRDVIMKLTDVSDQLKTVDVTEVVGKKLNKSKVENLEQETDMNDITDAQDTKANDKMVRPHVPVTKVFDRIQDHTTGGDMEELIKIKKEKKKDIDKITQVLKRKFRFKTRPRFRPNQEEGGIDTRELWRIPNSLGTKIFEIQQKKHESKVQVSIAVDISGSMDKDATENGRKVQELAVMLSEALTTMKVKHEVVGFGASPNYDVERYQGGATFNRRRHALETIIYKKLQGGSGLQNISLEPWDNADGESLRLVAERLAKAGAKKKIVFVISDGKPYLEGEDTAVLDFDLHKAISECEKKGVSVYGFGFNDTPEQFYGDKYCKVENTEKLIEFLTRKIEQIS